MRLLALLLVSFIAAGVPAVGAALSPAQIKAVTQVVNDTMTRGKLPALQVAIAHNGEIWASAFGKADMEQDVDATNESRFRTASVVKWMTGTAALRLQEDGKLDLDAPVQRYCPQFPAKPWPISARQLLTHTAGIRHYYGQNGEKPANEAERRTLDEKIAKERAAQFIRHTDVITPLEGFKNDPLLFQPGTQSHYSSLDYRLLACVMEGAAQLPYRQLMRELVFAPAGMRHIVEDDALAIIPHRVAGYSKDDKGNLIRTEFRDVSENLSAGGYLATAEDLVKFALAFKEGKLVKPATRDQMLAHPMLANGTPALNPMGTPGYHYGMGVMVDPSSEQPSWFHTGGQSGATALLFYFPKDDVVVGLMTNLDGGAIREGLARSIGKIAAMN